MIRILRDFRLLPLVLVAAVSLLALKSFGLMFGGGYILGPPAHEDTRPAAVPDPGDAGDIVGSITTPAKSEPPVPEVPAVTAPAVPAVRFNASPASRPSWAQEMFNFPDVTGAIGGGDKKSAAPAPAPGSTAVGNDSSAASQVRSAARNAPEKPGGAPEQRIVSPSERAILERLQERRKDLESRARELDMRESLIKAAEKRLEGRVSELKQVEERIKVATDRQDDATSARFKGLVSMYENMKAKDAARIFDRLDLKILTEVAGNINPRRMSDILANMSPEAAERLTVEFANRGNGPKTPVAADLPKIEGRPTASP